MVMHVSLPAEGCLSRFFSDEDRSKCSGVKGPLVRALSRSNAFGEVNRSVLIVCRRSGARGCRRPDPCVRHREVSA